MPIFDYRCELCGERVRTMKSSSKEHANCGGVLVRKPTGATSQQVEVVDNGLMPRRVERLAGVEEMVHERAVEDPRFRKE